MRESRAAFGFRCCVQLVQQHCEGFGFIVRQHRSQVLVEGCFDLCFGGFHGFRLFRGIQQLTAAVVRSLLTHQKAFRFQIFRPPRDGCLVCVQQFRQRRLCAAGMVPQRVNQINFCRADALFAQGQQDEFLCFPRDFCDFPFGDIHMCTSVTLMVVCASLYMQLL